MGYRGKFTLLTKQLVCSVIEFTSITDVRLLRYYSSTLITKHLHVLLVLGEMLEKNMLDNGFWSILEMLEKNARK